MRATAFHFNRPSSFTFLRVIGRICAGVVLAAGALSACSDNGIGPSDGVSGTYSLKTVNGAVLPFTDYQDASFKSEILAKTIVIRHNRTFTETTTFRSTEDGIVDVGSGSFSGTWTSSGNDLALLYPDGIAETITITSGALTASDGVNLFLFRR